MQDNPCMADDETLDDLLLGSLKIFQKREGYRFSQDAILLADFIGVPDGESIVDLGTGSGVIPLLLAHKTKISKIAGIEIQRDLAEMAGRSVAFNNLSSRISIIQEDLRNIADVFPPESFDIVLSNPPYRIADGGRISPHSQKAVAHHEIKCSLGDILKAASYLVRLMGKVYLIFPALRLPELICRLKEFNLEPKKLQIVYSGANSEGKRILVQASKGGGAGLTIMKPLHDAAPRDF